MKVLVALGGNALTLEGQRGTYDQMYENATAAARAILPLHNELGHELLLTHGNGPQIGALGIQHRAADESVPPLPMHVLGAMTQGELGYLLQQAVMAVDASVRTATVLTRVVVDEDDPEFSNPTKPIGPFYAQEDAERLSGERGWTVIQDADRGYRRVVPSPEPVEILEVEAVRVLAEHGILVIAGGGGGIPVSRRGGDDGDGSMNGADAVIDKDRSAAALGAAIGADALVMLTGVDRVALDFGGPNHREIERLTVTGARRYLSEGHFPSGSMGPKVEAAIRFVEGSGGRAVIAAPEHVVEALAGERGSSIVPDAEGPSVLVNPGEGAG